MLSTFGIRKTDYLFLLLTAAYPSYAENDPGDYYYDDRGKGESNNVGSYHRDQFLYDDYPKYNYDEGAAPYGKLDYDEVIAPPYDYQKQLRKPEAKSYSPPSPSKSNTKYVPVVVKKKKKKRT